MTAVRPLVIALGALVVGLACERSPAGPTPDPAAPTLLANLSKSGGLLSCKPLGYDSATQTIGPAGGVLKISKHNLVVPAGALSAVVSITAVAPLDTVNRVALRPEGLTFNQPALLTMFYGNCRVIPQSKQIAYTTDSLVILQYVPSSDTPTAKLVTGQLSHFSNYAIAW